MDLPRRAWVQVASPQDSVNGSVLFMIYKNDHAIDMNYLAAESANDIYIIIIIHLLSSFSPTKKYFPSTFLSPEKTNFKEPA